jgi:hypothetical protein
MRYTSWAVLIGLGVVWAGPAGAQPPRRDGEAVKKIEAELAELKAKTEKLEADLKKAREADKKPPSKPAFSGKPFEGKPPFARGGMDQKQMQEMLEQMQKMMQGGKPMMGGFQRDGFGQFGSRRQPETVEARIDRLIKELEELKAELKKK